MKYLFINSVAGFGSTGRIAAEQCRGLMAQGHECVLAFGREEANCGDISTVRIGTPLDFRLHGAKSRLLDDSGFGGGPLALEQQKPQQSGAAAQVAHPKPRLQPG